MSDADSQADIRVLIERWAGAVRDEDIDDVLADQSALFKREVWAFAGAVPNL